MPAPPEPRAPSTRYAWYVVAMLSLANVSGNVDRGVLGILVPSIERDFHISDTQASLLQGLAFGLFFAVLGLPIARWADRYNRRNIIAGGAALWSVFTAASAAATSFLSLLAMRIGVGVGEASLNAPSVSLIADYFPRDRLGRAMSVYSLGIFFGAGLGYLLGGVVFDLTNVQGTWHVPLLGDIHPWRATFIAVGLPGLLLALLLLTIREPRRGASVAPHAPPVRELVRYVRENARAYLTHGLGFAMFGVANYALAFWIPAFFARTFRWGEGYASRVQGVLTMTIGVAGVVCGGALGDWFVRRGRVDGPMRVGIVGAVGMLISAPAFTLVPTPALAVIVLAIVNFFAAFPWGAAAAAVAEMTPPALRAQGAALYFFALSLVSGTVGPIAVGIFTDHVFGKEGVRYSLAVVTALSMALTVLLLAAGLGSFRRALAREALAREMLPREAAIEQN
jgi:MFS family permease